VREESVWEWTEHTDEVREAVLPPCTGVGCKFLA